MLSKIIKAAGLRTFVLAVLISIPIWIIFALPETNGFLPAIFYTPGGLIYLIVAPILGLGRALIDSVFFICTCIAYFLIIWLIVHIFFRIRRRRKVEE